MRIRSAFASYGREGIPIIPEIPAMFHDPSTHPHAQQNYSPADRKAYELNKASYHLVYRLSLSLSLTFGDELFECFSLFLSMFTPPAPKKVECRVGVANIGKPVILSEESGGLVMYFVIRATSERTWRHRDPEGRERRSRPRVPCWGAKERHLIMHTH